MPNSPTVVDTCGFVSFLDGASEFPFEDSELQEVTKNTPKAKRICENFMVYFLTKTSFDAVTRSTFASIDVSSLFV